MRVLHSRGVGFVYCFITVNLNVLNTFALMYCVYTRFIKASNRSRKKPVILTNMGNNVYYAITKSTHLRNVLYCHRISGSTAFRAHGVVVPPGTGRNSDIRFPTIQLDTGSDYFSTAGVFTCRLPTLYWFSASLAKISDVDVDWVLCDIRSNGAVIL